MSPSTRSGNWATEQMAERLFELRGPEITQTPPPDMSLAMLTWFQLRYPPRCYEAEESVEAHLLYAGKVQLVRELQSLYDEAKRKDEDSSDVLRRG